jgi:hypothetical protein
LEPATGTVAMRATTRLRGMHDLASHKERDELASGQQSTRRGLRAFRIGLLGDASHIGLAKRIVHIGVLYLRVLTVTLRARMRRARLGVEELGFLPMELPFPGAIHSLAGSTPKHAIWDPSGFRQYDGNTIAIAVSHGVKVRLALGVSDAPDLQSRLV